MLKRDHIFFLSTKSHDRLILAFCSADQHDQNSAKLEIQHVLENKKIISYQLNYLGMVDYRDMEEPIVDQLHFFEKHGDVWLLL